MDFSKEIVVKIEMDYSDMELDEDIEDLNSGWCIDGDFINICDIKNEESVFIKEEYTDVEFMCLRCHRLFFDSHGLLRHNLTHLQIKLVKLPQTIYGYKYNLEDTNLPKESNKDTIKNIKTELTDTCDEEDSDSIDNDKFSETETNTNEDVPITKRLYTCKICHKDYSYKHWHEHMNNVHSKKRINCSKCSKEYKCKKNYNRHPCVRGKFRKKNKKKIENEKEQLFQIFQCSQCISIFQDKDNLRQHMKNVHRSAVVCEICGSRLASPAYLHQHKTRVHYDDGKVHSCDICGIFKSPRYVKVHIKNSHNAKKKV